jgi:excisionase family DNA binding protein
VVDVLQRLEHKLDMALARAGEARYLDVGGAAAYLNVSPQTVRRLLTNGRLKACRPVPRRVLIDRLTLDELMRT